MVVVEDTPSKRSKKSTLLIAAIVIAAIVVIGLVVTILVHNHHEKVKATFQSKLTLLTGTQPITTNIVAIRSSALSPEQLTVKKGAIVSWFNLTKTKETVTENGGKAGPNSGIIPATKIYQYQYNTVGTFKYHSALNSKMAGTVTVVNNVSASSLIVSSKKYTATGPYKGWKSYSLKYEKLNFFYPSAFKLNDTSTKGHDMVTLKGSNGFTATLQTGSSTPATLPAGSTIVNSLPVLFAGKEEYLDYLASSSNTNLVNQVYVSTSATNATAAPAASNASGLIEMSAGYPSSNPGEALTTIEKDTNYLDAQLVIESMHY